MFIAYCSYCHLYIQNPFNCYENNIFPILSFKRLIFQWLVIKFHDSVHIVTSPALDVTFFLYWIQYITIMKQGKCLAWLPNIDWKNLCSGKKNILLLSKCKWRWLISIITGYFIITLMQQYLDSFKSGISHSLEKIAVGHTQMFMCLFIIYYPANSWLTDNISASHE